MTPIFSFSRLLQLIKKQWVENSRMYFLSALALLALQALIFGFWVKTSGPSYAEDFVYIIFLIGIYISGAIFASTTFSMLGDKNKGTYWLGFPASHLEKLICMIFYSTIFFTLVYCATFFAVKMIAVTYIEGLVRDHPELYSYRHLKDREGFWNVFSFFGYTFFAVQAFYLLGSVYFSRYSFILTTVIGSALIGLFIYVIAEYLQSVVPDKYRFGGAFVQTFISEPGTTSTYRHYMLSPFVTGLLIFLAKFIWAPVFWLVSWFRLKEKQI